MGQILQENEGVGSEEKIDRNNPNTQGPVTHTKKYINLLVQ